MFITRRITDLTFRLQQGYWNIEAEIYTEFVTSMMSNPIRDLGFLPA
jgi:hypothetical protein